MGCLDELAERLGLKELDFRHVGEVNSSPTTNTEQSSVDEDLIDEDLLNSKNFDFLELSELWEVPEKNIITLYEHVKHVYIEQTEEGRVLDLCETILYGMLNKNIKKDYLNILINQLNTILTRA